MLLGLEADRAARTLVSRAPALPDWVGSLRLLGVRAHGATWDVSVGEGRVTVEPADRARAASQAGRER